MKLSQSWMIQNQQNEGLSSLDQMNWSLSPPALTIKNLATPGVNSNPRSLWIQLFAVNTGVFNASSVVLTLDSELRGVVNSPIIVLHTYEKIIISAYLWNLPVKENIEHFLASATRPTYMLIVY